MLEVNNFYNLKVTKFVEDYSYVIEFEESYSIVIFCPLHTNINSSLEEIVGQSLIKIDFVNEEISFFFTSGLTIGVRLNEVDSPEILEFRHKKESFIVRTSDIDDFEKLIRRSSP